MKKLFVAIAVIPITMISCQKEQSTSLSAVPARSAAQTQAYARQGGGTVTTIPGIYVELNPTIWRCLGTQSICMAIVKGTRKIDGLSSAEYTLVPADGESVIDVIKYDGDREIQASYQSISVREGVGEIQFEGTE